MGMLAKSLKHSIWYASKILHGTRYAEQNKEVRGTPWGEGGIASSYGKVKFSNLGFYTRKGNNGGNYSSMSSGKWLMYT